jgi:hypothetical protein
MTSAAAAAAAVVVAVNCQGLAMNPFSSQLRHLRGTEV